MSTPIVLKTFMPNQDEALGPLMSTCTLTMAIPIITLPYERIFKSVTGESASYADDSRLNEDLTDKIKNQFKLPKLCQSEFFKPKT